jgi:predicted metalloprotease with PDZ domain
MKNPLPSLALLGALSVLGTAPMAQADSPASTFAVDLSQRASQIVWIEGRFEGLTPGAPLALSFPVWRTGLYRVIDPAGTVSQLTFEDGEGLALTLTRSGTSRWEGTVPPTGQLHVRYRLYGNSLEDRTRDLDANHAFLNPGAVFPYVEALRDAPVSVQLDLPESWALISGLEACGPGCVVAPTYDRLVDSPLEAGTFAAVEFAAGPVQTTVAIDGPWDGNAERLRTDVAALMTAAADVFGTAPLPTNRYLFLLHSGEGLGGGTEYYNSTVVHTDPRAFWDKKRYESMLSLFAHEYFHTWNVKRFRPAPIARYDYEQPTIVDLLWAAEGLTSYYDLLLLRRAKLVDDKRFLEMLGEMVDDVLDHPGYGRQSLAEASEEAWIKGYHRGRDRTPDKRNESISFYAQGGVLGLVLDLKLREATAGAASLDTLMTMLYEDFPLGGPGYDFLAMKARVHALASAELAEDFEGWVYGREPLPVAEALATVGLTLSRKPLKEGAATAALGARLREEGGRVSIRDVDRRAPAFTAGLQAEDELLAFAGTLVRSKDIEPLLRRHAPGETVPLTLGRRGELLTLPVPLGTAAGAWEISAAEEEAPPAAQVAWLTGEAPQP